jgi:DNA (cytosine-5)-methyltransferase 1
MTPDLTAVSLFAGIGGFDLALHRNGIDVVAAVEIDVAARGVLADNFPNTTLFEDVRSVTGDDLRAAGFVPERGIVTAGSPCQDLSVAGRRAGMGEGTRSGLFWEFDRLVAELRPAWIIFENVPGLLSAVCPDPDSPVDLNDLADIGDEDGFLLEDFAADGPAAGRGACEGGCFAAHGGAMGLVLGALADRGYGFAYRVLDAQNFGVPQRRRRVFIVGRFGGDSRGPVEVLLEPDGREGDPAAGGEAGPVVAALTADGVGTCGADDNQAQARHLIATNLGTRGNRIDSDATTTLIQVTHTLTGEGHDASEDGTGRGTPIIPIALRGRAGGSAIEVGEPGDPAFTLRTPSGGSSYPMAFNPKTGGDMRLGYGPKPTALTCSQETAVQLANAVRRLTPLECERLQGFPDRWTANSNGKAQADGPRYRQCGNAVAVPVVQWVALRIVLVNNRAVTA